MPKSHAAYAPEFRRQMVELIRSGRTPEELSLECELLARRRFASQAEAKMAVFSYIEGWYNLARRHSSIGYLSPIAYEANMANNAETT